MLEGDQFVKVAKIKRPQMIDLILEQLQNAILDGQLPVGTRLPPERELASALGVSRASLREALKAAALMGWIEIRPGEGSFVAKATSEKIIQPLSYVLMFDTENIGNIMELRSILEVETAGLAACRRSEEHLSEIRETMQRMEETASRNVEEFLEYDMLFHKKVDKAAGNPVLAKTNLILRELLREANRRVARLTEGRSTAIAAHHRIFTAIETRDEKAAREAALDHLKTVAGFVLDETRARANLIASPGAEVKGLAKPLLSHTERS
ncbi:MAG TPA: FadR family transcriptional regulator [Firmicutes bacterium]|nr:FadR family transcriptional regulator [Bacillota bacterium]